MQRLIVVIIAALALLTGCASTKTDASAAANRKVIDITVQGATITPNGEHIDVPLGSNVELAIHADSDGEIHVHSTPEQKIDYHPGTTQAYLGRLTVPGRITVESHTPDRTVMVLVVQ